MIRTVAVAGAGIMGQGIAQVCADSGFTTLLYDVREDQVKLAIDAINKNLSTSVEKGRISETHKVEILSRIHPVSSVDGLKADLLIEAAVEKLEVKQDLFARVEQENGGKIILASNTSSISINRIASVLKDPSKCIGLHFFNPADRMKLVEIISGQKTDPGVVRQVKEFSASIGKIAVLTKDSPGFIVNRVARHYYGESLKILEENASNVDTTDLLLRSAGFKMGPFELMDLIGLDTNLAVTRSVYEGFNQNLKFKPSPIQERLVKDGNLGRKTGKGFYDYK